MKILEADDLSFSYGKTMVLDQIRFSLDEGGFAALIGFNGAGKSTLIRLLLGELTPNSGSIRLMGHTVVGFPDTAEPLESARFYDQSHASEHERSPV